MPPPGAMGKQAVALRISGDTASFWGCKFIGGQDTLYDHQGRHYYKDCYMEGSVDFIFGNGLSLFEVTRKAKCHGRRFRVFVPLVSCILIGPAIDDEKMGQGCHLHATAMNFGAVTAQDRMSLLEDTGFSFVNCRVTGSGALYLGRAWGTFSRVVFAFTYMDNIIIPRGWHNWGDPNREMYVLSL